MRIWISNKVLEKHFCRGIDCDSKKAIMLRFFVNFPCRIESIDCHHHENVRLWLRLVCSTKTKSLHSLQFVE